MKHAYLLLLSVCMGMASLLPQAGRAQTTTSVSVAIGNTYAFTVPTTVTPCTLDGTPTGTPAKIARAHYEFTIVDATATAYIITFPVWSNNPVLTTEFAEKEITPAVKNAKGNVTVPAVTVPLFFTVSKDDLEKKVYRVYARWGAPEVSTGTVIIPVKMRFSEFDFSRDFSLGFSMGPRWRISRRRDHFVHLLGSFNVNIVNLDSANTNGRIRQATDKGALGLGLGGVFDFNGAQVGLFTGWDWLGRRDRNEWAYQGKPWLSMGLGFTIFSRTTTATPPVTKQ